MALSLEQEIGSIKNKIEKTKKKFAEYIKDKSIPLEKRWELFCSAPEYYKESQSWIVHFDCLKEIRKVRKQYETWTSYEAFDEDLYSNWERHSIHYCHDIVDSLEENLDCAEDCPNESWAQETLKWVECGFNRELIKKLKEEILEKNLGSFEYDW